MNAWQWADLHPVAAVLCVMSMSWAAAWIAAGLGGKVAR